MDPNDARQAGQAAAPNFTVIAPRFSDADLSQLDLRSAIQQLDSIVGDHRTERVVLAGFSAGAQLVQRFALGGRNKDVPAYFIVAAPGSYAYLTTDRPVPPGNCPSFNFWRFGLDRTPRGVDVDRQGYLGKSVLLIVGDQDAGFDGARQRCGEVAQGPSRLARAQSYLSHVQSMGASRHTLQVVPGAGHDIAAVFGAVSLS